MANPRKMSAKNQEILSDILALRERFPELSRESIAIRLKIPKRTVKHLIDHHNRKDRKETVAVATPTNIKPVVYWGDCESHKFF